MYFFEMKRSVFVMNKVNIKFRDVADVNRFVHILSKYDADFNLYCGSYYVDAKSIMGIFSLDLSKPLILNAGTEDEQKIKETFADFIGEE